MSVPATGKQLARDSMQNLRDYPHRLARPLALCFVFEPANTQFIAATCLEFGFTLDTALATPSESLLAMLRLQWWIDAIQDTATAHVPLAQNLHIQYSFLIVLYLLNVNSLTHLYRNLEISVYRLRIL